MDIKNIEIGQKFYCQGTNKKQSDNWEEYYVVRKGRSYVYVTKTSYAHISEIKCAITDAPEKIVETCYQGNTRIYYTERGMQQYEAIALINQQIRKVGDSSLYQYTDHDRIKGRVEELQALLITLQQSVNDFSGML